MSNFPVNYFTLFFNRGKSNHTIIVSPNVNKNTLECQIATIHSHAVKFSVSEVKDIIPNAEIMIKKFNDNPSDFEQREREEKLISSLHTYSYFREIFTSEEIDILKDAKKHSLLHPLYESIQSYEKEGRNARNGSFKVSINTELGVYLALKHDKEWLISLKDRLADTTDEKNSISSSALAELRAYGALRSAGCPVRPVATMEGKPTTDFEFEIDDKIIKFEVHTRLLDDIQLANIEKFNTESTDNPCRWMVVDPFGEPNPNKKNDGVTTNTISKICATKQEEHQLDSEAVNILWIDLQDSLSIAFDVGDVHSEPFFSYTNASPNDDGFWWPTNMPASGAFWYALYGEREDEVIESSGMGPLCIHKMGHDGRFSRKSKSIVNFAIIATHNRIVVFENPHRVGNVPFDLRPSFITLPHMSMEHSVMEIYPNFIKNEIVRGRIVSGFYLHCLKTIYPENFTSD